MGGGDLACGMFLCHKICSEIWLVACFCATKMAVKVSVGRVGEIWLVACFFATKFAVKGSVGWVGEIWLVACFCATKLSVISGL